MIALNRRVLDALVLGTRARRVRSKTAEVASGSTRDLTVTADIEICLDGSCGTISHKVFYRRRCARAFLSLFPQLPTWIVTCRLSGAIAIVGQIDSLPLIDAGYGGAWGGSSCFARGWTNIGKDDFAIGSDGLYSERMAPVRLNPSKSLLDKNASANLAVVEVAVPDREWLTPRAFSSSHLVV